MIDLKNKRGENMSNTKEFYVTTVGLEEMENELKELKEVKRPQVIDALKYARELGDLSENAEYDAAREQQAIVEGRIVELEAMIENAIVIQDVKTDKVAIGTTVTIEYVEDNETEEYSIVGVQEADPFSNKISNESPIAKAIMGCKEGNIVKVDSPNGEYTVKIVAIN